MALLYGPFKFWCAYVRVVWPGARDKILAPPRLRGRACGKLATVMDMSHCGRGDTVADVQHCVP